MANDASKSKRLYGVLAGVALLAVGYWAWALLAAGDDIPDTPESRTAWLCEKCEHTVELTAKEQFDLAEKAAEWSRNTEGKEVISARRAALHCPACSQVSLLQAGKCVACQKIYDPRSAPPGYYCGPCAKSGVKPRIDIAPNDE
jgi:hypothetical protein